MSSPDLPQLFFSNRFCSNLSAIVVSEILTGTEELQLPCAKPFYSFSSSEYFPNVKILLRWRGIWRHDWGGRGGGKLRTKGEKADYFVLFFKFSYFLRFWVKSRACLQRNL